MVKLLLLLYYCGCFVYAYFTLRARKQDGLLKTLIALSIPFLGSLLAWRLFRNYGHMDVKPIEIEPRTVEDEPLNHTGDAKKDLNFVSIQDALILDNKDKRKLSLHSLRESILHDAEVLKDALESEDTETSPYAATADMESKRKLFNAIHHLSKTVNTSPEDFASMKQYAKSLKEFLKNGFLDESSYARYEAQLSAVLAVILENDEGSQEHFIDKINYELAHENNDQAKYYSNLFLRCYPFDEMSYIMAMKIQYTMHNPSGIQRTIKDLKKQPIQLSANGQELASYANFFNRI